MDAIASGLGANVEHGIAGAARGALDDVVDTRDAEAEDVHQWVTGVHLVEDDLAAGGGNADAVAVSTDAGDNTFEDAAGQCRVERSKAQGVEQRNRPRAHREDVANDATHASGRALIRLDERWMVVRLD